MKTSSITILTTLLVVSGALADIIHVPGDYDTIQEGIDAAISGDIVLVAPGHYIEEIELKSGVIVRGAGEGRSIIDGGGDAGDVVKATGNAITNDTKLQGFTITGAANSGGMPGGGGIFCNSGAKPDISNCRIEGNDTGIACWNGSEAYIHNNVITNNVYNGVSTGAGITLVNNTIHNNRIGFGDHSGYRPVVMNNIITGSSMFGISAPSSGNDPQLSYNDVWGNDSNYHQCVPGPGDISADPMYADTGNGDYTLATGSPCIDSGNPDPQYNDPDGSRNDIGAYGGPGAVSTIPQVVSLSPARNALDVDEDTELSAGFNLEMDPLTLNDSSFLVRGAWSGLHPGDVEYDTVARVVLFTPDHDFQLGEPVTAWLTNSVTTTSGDTLGGYSWQFYITVDDGSGRFADTVGYAPGSGVTDILTGDFNGDEQLDLVTCNYNPGSVSFFQGNGDGTFENAVSTSTDGLAFSACAADFDSDGETDLAFTRLHSNRVAVMFGSGDGSFEPAVDYPTGGDTRRVCCGDFDLDGDFDLAGAVSSLHSAAVLLNNGDGSFAPAVTYAAGELPEGIACADMDNNGFPDLVIGNDEDTVSVLLGLGDGTFEPGPAHGAVAYCFGPVLTGDFLEDGNADALVVEEYGARILLGDGTGRLTRGSRLTGSGSVYGGVVGDVNGDGHLDAMLVDTNDGNELTVHLGDGTGEFTEVGQYGAGEDPLAVCTGDFDEDGDLDAAVGSYNTPRVTVLLNDDQLYVSQTHPPTYGLAAPETTDVAAQFNMGISEPSLDSASFLVYGTQTGIHRGAITYNSGQSLVTLDPAADFAPGDMVTALLTTNITSTTGVSLLGYGWSFTAAVPYPSSGEIGNPTHFASGTKPRGFWTADYDSDGNIDVAVTNNTSQTTGAVVVMLGDGNGRLGSPDYTTIAGDPMSMFGADFDADGDVDLAVYHNQPGTSTLEILKNDGAGDFTLAHTYAPAILGQDIAGADFDADGDIDIVLSDGWGSQDNVRVMTNTGSGAFSGPTIYSAGSAARGCAVLDAEGDGDFDIIVANASNSNFTLLSNDGHGAFPVIANYGAGSSPNRLFVNDFNDDRFPDVAVTSSGGEGLTVALNTGYGTFAAPVTVPAGTGTRFIAGGDLDGDGDIDIAATSSSADSGVAVFNDGTGLFTGLTKYGLGDSPWGIGMADYNNDGALDIANANYNSNTVSILLGAGLGIGGGPGNRIPRRLEISAAPSILRRSTRLSYAVPKAGHVALELLDVTGRVVTVPVSGWHEAGTYTRNWSPEVAGGVYFLRIVVGESAATRRVTVVE